VSRLDLTPLLRPERGELLDLLASLDDDEWERPTECPAWSVKGVALHVLGDDLSLLARQRDAATNGLVLFAEDHPGAGFRELLDGFNEQWVRASRFLSTELVAELLRLTGEWSAAFYGSVDLDSPGEQVGFFAGSGTSPYWQAVAREYVERWVHQHQIRRATGRPDLGDDFLAPAAAAIVRSLAAHLPDLDAEPGPSIVVAIPGVEAWALDRTGDRWTVSDGPPANPTVRLALARDVATTALSRGLPGREAEDAFTAEGDAALAGRVVGVIGSLLRGRAPAAG
jgi:uncharacterized protein (TIGR03083 family)